MGELEKKDSKKIEAGKKKLERRGGGGTTKIPFFGTVIDELVASKISRRELIVDIGNNGGHGPQLYLSAQDWANTNVSRHGASFFIPPLPKPKEKKQDALRAAQLQSPPKKKAKSVGPVPASQSGVVTHKTAWEEAAAIRTTNEAGTLIALKYYVPFLLEVEADPEVGKIESPLFRARTKLDDSACDEGLLENG